jgi:hypothetical protein
MVNNIGYNHFKFHEVNPKNMSEDIKSEEMKIREDIKKGFELCKIKRKVRFLKISMSGYSQEIGFSSRNRLWHLIKGKGRIDNDNKEKLKSGYEKELTLDVCEKELPNLFKKHKYDGSFKPPLKKVRKETDLSNAFTFSPLEAGSGNNILTLEPQPQFLLHETTQTSNISPQQNINIEASTTKCDGTLELTKKRKNLTKRKIEYFPIPNDLLKKIKIITDQKLDEGETYASLNQELSLKHPQLLGYIVNDHTKSVIEKDLIALKNFVSQERIIIPISEAKQEPIILPDNEDDFLDWEEYGYSEAGNGDDINNNYSMNESPDNDSPYEYKPSGFLQETLYKRHDFY